jgi:hypothetical protein
LEEQDKAKNQMRIKIAKAVQAKMNFARKKACEEGIMLQQKRISRVNAAEQGLKL